jgi:hypothetical protein
MVMEKKEELQFIWNDGWGEALAEDRNSVSININAKVVFLRRLHERLTFGRR